MPYLDWLAAQVTPRLRSGAIGLPVFVRANLEIHADHGLLFPAAAEALEAAVGWLDGSVKSIYAQGSVRDGFVSLLVEFSNGRTALIGVEVHMEGDPSARLLIVGQHGTLRLDDFPELPQLANPTIGAAARWIPMIERSLVTKRPAAAAEQ